MLTPVDIRIDYQRPPATIATLRPSVSWRGEVNGEASGHPSRALDQKAYRIQIAGDRGFRFLLRDSGWVQSAQSVAIPWDGEPLAPLARYWVRIAIDSGEPQGTDLWSETVSFETAAVGIPWDVPFLSAPVHLLPPDASRPVYLRRRFFVEETPARPRLLVTALGLYEVWINGERVGEQLLTPGWTAYEHRVSFQTYDVEPLLRRGENVIGVVLGYGWYAGDLTWFGSRNLYGDRPALSLCIVDADRPMGGSLLSSALVSSGDASAWGAAHGALRYAELYHGEEYDAREELPEWNIPSRGANDPGEDRGWHPCESLPETSEIERRVRPDEGPAVVRQETLAPSRVFTTPNGETVLDFGQNLTGWVRVSVTGRPGERIALSHGEVLDRDGNLYTENLRGARNRTAYIVGYGPETTGAQTSWEPRFSFQGFRYVRIDDMPDAVSRDVLDHPERYFSAVVVHSAMESTLEFSCSDERVNRLHHNILWGWKGNSVHVPTDCPQRDERLGWTGDAQVFVGTASYLMNVRAFFRRWLRDLALEQRHDGGVPFVIPDVLSSQISGEGLLKSTHSSTGWGDAAVVCPSTLWGRFGDRETLEAQYPSMRAWIDHIHGRAEDGVVWNSGFHFGDWVALDAEEGSFFGATPNEFTATAYYAHSTALTARAAEALGRVDEAEELHALHDRIVNAFRARYLTPEGRLAVSTQTAHVLALSFGLIPEETRPGVVRDLVTLIRVHDNHLVTGFLGTPLLLSALADNGELDEAYALLMREEYPSWLYQVSAGATTIWEHWDGRKPDGTMWSAEMNSFNHYAYGAVGEWIYQTVGGIDLSRSSIPDREFRIAPRPGGGITAADTTYRSCYGDVSVRWRILDGNLKVSVTIPPNTRGMLVLPGRNDKDTDTPERIEPGTTTRVVPVEIGVARE